MYLPDYFNENDPAVIFDFISSNSFAMPVNCYSKTLSY